MINIILAEDHTIVREGIKILLESDSNICIVGEANSGTAALQQLNSGISADILISDLKMPDMDGFTLIKEMKAQHPHVHIIILTMVTDENEIHKAFTTGAEGYLLKTSDLAEIIFAVKHVLNGKKYICSELSNQYYEKSISNSFLRLREKPDVELNSREIALISLVAEGFTNSEMSEKLFLSKRTVEGQRQALIEKTGCKNTAALIKYALKQGIID